MSRQWHESGRLPRHESDDLRASSNANTHRIPCPWSACLCTHKGCVAGWIDRTLDDGTGLGKDVAIPCPMCRPKLSEHLRKDGTPDSWRESQRGAS